MSSPLLDKMLTQYQYPLLDEDTIDPFIAAQDECVLFFTEDPQRFPETNDVVMILPELVKEYGGRFSVGVISQKSQRKLQARYGFREWPTLVFLRRGQFLGSISRVQDWVDYIIKINDLLSSEGRPEPGFDIPIEVESSTRCNA